MFCLVVRTITLLLLILSLEAVVSISTRNEFGAIARSLSKDVLVELYRMILKLASKECVRKSWGKVQTMWEGHQWRGPGKKAHKYILLHNI